MKHLESFWYTVEEPSETSPKELKRFLQTPGRALFVETSYAKAVQANLSALHTLFDHLIRRRHSGQL